jgi:DNA polymerase I
MGAIISTERPELAPKSCLWGLDVESTGLTPRSVWDPAWGLRKVQLAPQDDVCYVIDIDDVAGVEWARSVLADPANVFVAHGQLDPIALRKALNVNIFGRVIDTQALTLMCAPDDRLGQGGLKPIADKYGHHDLVAAETELNNVFIELYRAAHPGKRVTAATAAVKSYGFSHVPSDHPAYIRYAGLDAMTVRALLPHLIKDSRAPRSLLRMERWLTEQALGIAWRGQRVDVAALESMERAVNSQADKLTDIVAEATGGLRPGQFKAVGQWLQESGMDLTGHPRTDKGALSFAKDNLHLLGEYPCNDTVARVRDAFIAYSGLTDQLRRTAEIRKCMGADGRVHSTLNTVGAVTGRMTASGLNMQNFSKKDSQMRRLFIPDEGHSFISCDFAQVEARVTAAIAGCKDMLRVIAEGGDLHQLTADKAQCSRQKAKTLNFQVLYGVGVNKLSGFLGCSAPEAKEYLNNYWKGYPEIAQLNCKLKELNEVYTYSGRRVPTGSDVSGRLKVHANLNYLIQGTARELLVGAWRRFATTPDRAGMLWFPIHDELVLQVPNDRVEEILLEVQSAMKFNFFGVAIDASADVLVDTDGSSRWMAGDDAVAVAGQRADAGV